MQAKDLEIFNDMPFFAWVKDENGTYLWANRALIEFAGEEVVGKSDDHFAWAEDPEQLRENDRRVLETGNPLRLQERVVRPTSQQKVQVSTCKSLTQFEGKKCTFGIAFGVQPSCVGAR